MTYKSAPINFLNKYFSLIMMFLIFSTFFVYKNKQRKISHFIENSTECVLVLENFDEDQKLLIKNKLKKLTFQEVMVEENNGVAYFKIKCPPDRLSFFRKWILENKE